MAVNDGHNVSSSLRRKVVIDTDAGLDDAQAILLALAHRDELDVVAITTVHGNVDVHQVTKNVFRLLKVAERLDVRTSLKKPRFAALSLR